MKCRLKSKQKGHSFDAYMSSIICLFFFPSLACWPFSPSLFFPLSAFFVGEIFAFFLSYLCCLFGQGNLSFEWNDECLGSLDQSQSQGIHAHTHIINQIITLNRARSIKGINTNHIKDGIHLFIPYTYLSIIFSTFRQSRHTQFGTNSEIWNFLTQIKRIWVFSLCPLVCLCFYFSLWFFFLSLLLNSRLSVHLKWDEYCSHHIVCSFEMLNWIYRLPFPTFNGKPAELFKTKKNFFFCQTSKIVYSWTILT